MWNSRETKTENYNEKNQLLLNFLIVFLNDIDLSKSLKLPVFDVESLLRSLEERIMISLSNRVETSWSHQHWIQQQSSGTNNNHQNNSYPKISSLEELKGNKYVRIKKSIFLQFYYFFYFLFSKRLPTFCDFNIHQIG